MKNCKYAFLSIVTTISLFLNYKEVYSGSTHKILAVDTITASIMCAIIFYFYKTYKEKEVSFITKIISVMFSIILIFGKSYSDLNSWDYVLGSKRMFVISSIVCFGYYCLLSRLIQMIINNAPKLTNILDLKDNKLIRILDKRTFTTSFIIIILCWMPYIISFYPAILSPDPSYQIMQFYNERTKYVDYAVQLDPSVNLTNHHPVMHTILLGGCIQLGRKILDDNFGLFVYSFVQIIILASTLSYTIKYLKKRNVPLIIRSIMLLTYSLVPMFPFYAMSAVKDTIYTALIILFVIRILNILDNKDKESNLDMIKTVTLGLLLSLFRNNGIYVVILSLIAVILYCKDKRKRQVVVLSLIVSLFFIYSNVILPYFKITNTSIREALTIPFQQTARLAKVNDDAFSSKDKEVIDKLIGYDDLAYRYNPNLSDPVKNKFNKLSTKEDLNNYFKVWFKGLIKYPDVYLQATLNNTYGYLYPNENKWYFYHRYDSRIYKDKLLNYKYNDLKKTRSKLVKYANEYRQLPIIGLMENTGFGSWILIIYSCILFKIKQRKYIIALIPLNVSLLICFASPANNYFRYAMPYLFTIPLLFGVMYSIMTNKKDGFNNSTLKSSFFLLICLYLIYATFYCSIFNCFSNILLNL